MAPNNIKIIENIKNNIRQHKGTIWSLPECSEGTWF
jgi:hypothetical protein